MGPGHVLVHRRGGEALVQIDDWGTTALEAVAHDARSAGGLHGPAAPYACRVVVDVALCPEAVEAAARHSITVVNKERLLTFKARCRSS